MYYFNNIKFNIIKIIILIFLSLYLINKFNDISMLIIIPLSIKTLSLQTDFKKVTFEYDLNLFYSKEKTLDSVEAFLNGLDANENYVCIITILQNKYDYNESDLNKFICEPFLIN
jgi:hypothetical protein